MALIETKNPADGVMRIQTGRLLENTTAVAIKVITGFRPKYVKVINQAPTGGFLEWFEGMANASAQKFLTNGAVFAQGALITANGITPAVDGFTIGLDTDINVVNEQMSYLAVG